MRVRSRAIIGAILLVTVALYSLWLGYSPIYMHDAEVLFALHARSIAATLRDSNGTFLPLYFHMPSIGANVWFHPMIVYFSAVFLKVLPFTDWSVRFPSVVVGTIDVLLIYLVAARLFRSRVFGVIAAVLLALTPAHFIHSRIEMDYLYPVPFVLAWLWCLLKFDETEEPWLLWLAGFILGAGFYSYIAAVVFMPLYIVFTWFYLLAKYRRLSRAHLSVTVAFCLPLIFFVAWRILYPEVFSGTAYRYAITRRGVAFGVLRLYNYNLIGDYVSNYWNFYNPNFLFLVGSPNFQSSTRAAGVFLIPVALFLAAGLYQVVAHEKTRVGWLLIAGLVTAPIPAVLVEEPFAIYREMEILVFAILLATFGVRMLLRSGSRTWRAVAMAALIAMPVQFAYFMTDYFTSYRLNSYGWFGGNIRAVVQKVKQLDGERPIPAIYLSPRIPYGIERWQYYLAEGGDERLLARTRSLNATEMLSDLPPGSLLVVPIEDGEVKDERVKPSNFREVADIEEPFGTHPKAFALFQRP
jgi:4-amino-4-deoxy-L-arabinose transferase-like glycosyltransferase